MLKEGDCTAMKIKRCILALSACFMLLLSSCTPKIVVTPSPIGIEVMPATPEICVESAVPDITVSPVGEIVISEVYSERYTEELVKIVMENKIYPWPMGKVSSVEYQGNGLWLVTVKFRTLSKQYIFDEVNHD